MNLETYRLLEDGEETWKGKAYSPEQAEERAFFDESPSSQIKYTLQRWGRVQVSRENHVLGWVTLYTF
jgi:hypothetical protein